MDDQTLKKAIDGNLAAFRSIYNEFFDGLFAYVLSRTKRREESEDIVSESFLTLFENIKNIKYAKAVKSYLYKIAIHKMANFYTRPKTLTFKEDTLAMVEVESTGSKKQPVNIDRILCKLPKLYCEVLKLRYLAGLQHSEIADILDKTEGNIKVIQNRALKKAQQILFSLYKLK